MAGLGLSSLDLGLSARGPATEATPSALVIRIGQSNDIGLASDDSGAVTTSNVYNFNNSSTWEAMGRRPDHGSWASAEAIDDDDSPGSGNFGTDRQFITDYRAAHPDRDIYVCGTSKGGTGYGDDWAWPSGVRTTSAITRIAAALAAMPAAPTEVIVMSAFGENDAINGYSTTYASLREDTLFGILDDVGLSTGTTLNSNVFFIESIQSLRQTVSYRAERIMAEQASIGNAYVQCSPFLNIHKAVYSDTIHYDADTTNDIGSNVYPALVRARANTSLSAGDTPSVGAHANALALSAATKSVSATIDSNANVALIVAFWRGAPNPECVTMTWDGNDVPNFLECGNGGNVCVGLAEVTAGETKTAAVTLDQTASEVQVLVIPLVNVRFGVSPGASFQSNQTTALTASTSIGLKTGCLTISLAISKVASAVSQTLTTNAANNTVVTGVGSTYNVTIGYEVPGSDSTATRTATLSAGSVTYNSITCFTFEPT